MASHHNQAISRLSYWIASIALAMAIFAPTPARAAFHLWNLNEIYTNSSGTLQFIELQTTSTGQNAVSTEQITVSNVGNTQSKTFTVPSDLTGNTANHTFLIGTAGLQAAGGPAPDYILPNGFLFAAGGSISFFGANSGAYSALPTDGITSRAWTSGANTVNSPTNFAGQTGSVAPEPTALSLLIAAGGIGLLRRRPASAQ